MSQKPTNYFIATDKLLEYAKVLRKSQTSAEKYFWQIIRNRKVAGLKFRRQHPIGNYIIDFYCDDLKLAVELDGYIHDLKEVQEYDKKRQFEIEQKGVTVLRFTNDQVFNDLDFVIECIIEHKKNSDMIKDY